MNPATLLDNIMADSDFEEQHSIFIPASTEITYNAMKQVAAKDIPLFTPFMWIRTLPARISGKPLEVDGTSPVLEDLTNEGFTILDEKENSEIVFGIIGKFWKLIQDELVEINSAEDFIKFNTPLYAKAAANLMVTPHDNGTIVSTATRITATCKKGRKKFGRYWFAIRIGSGLIRRSWLKAIKRRAMYEEKRNNKISTEGRE